MARRRGSSVPTKKHLARAERERRLTRNILLGSGAVLLLVLGLLGYGVLEERVVQPNQPVALVNEAEISTEEFQKQVRFDRSQLVSQYINIAQTLAQVGGDPSIASIFGSNLSQIELQLDNPAFLGQSALDRLIEDRLIRQEAESLGITVSDAEVDQSIEAAFGFFPGGTPTPTATLEPLATSTLTALQRSLVSPTPTLTQTLETATTPTVAPEAEPTAAEGDDEEPGEGNEGDAEATATAVPSPSPTATPYTREAFEEQLQETLDNLGQNIGYDQDDLRANLEAQLYREKVFEAKTSDLPRVQDQVWARHILVEDEETAQAVLQRLEDGEDWTDLAAELSIDEGNKDRGGDLRWFTRGQMVMEFETIAFSLQVGQISEPVETSFGWHIIQVLGHEERPLGPQEYQQERLQAFQEWLTEARESAEVELFDYWTTRIPEDPEIPLQLRAQVQQLLAPAPAALTPPPAEELPTAAPTQAQ